MQEAGQGLVGYLGGNGEECDVYSEGDRKHWRVGG